MWTTTSGRCVRVDEVQGERLPFADSVLQVDDHHVVGRAVSFSWAWPAFVARRAIEAVLGECGHGAPLEWRHLVDDQCVVPSLRHINAPAQGGGIIAAGNKI